MRILIIDDEPDLRVTLAEFVEKSGHMVLQASDPASALELARRHMPDVAIIDGLFGAGVDLVSQLRRAGISNLVAASSNPGLSKAMREAGCRFSMDKLRAFEEIPRIISAIERHASSPAASVAA